jgi:choline kinase
MGKYGSELPKALLPLAGKTLLEWQVQTLRQAGADEIVVVTGFRNDLIDLPGLKYYHNPRYAETNMLESLMAARQELDDDLLLAYGDIVYSSQLAQLAMASQSDIGVVVDEAWREYWLLRYGTTETDLESCTVSTSGLIEELGLPVEVSAGIGHRYVGLLRFSRSGIRTLLEIYDRKRQVGDSWRQSGKAFEQGYMTDMLHEAITSGHKVTAIITHGGWLEFDTEQDYEVCTALAESGQLSKVCPLACPC